LRGAAGVQPHRCGLGRNVSALDVSIQAQIVNLLEEPKQRRSLAMLFVSHDLAVKYLSGWIAVIDLGRVMEIGPSRRRSAQADAPSPGIDLSICACKTAGMDAQSAQIATICECIDHCFAFALWCDDFAQHVDPDDMMMGLDRAFDLMSDATRLQSFLALRKLDDSCAGRRQRRTT
jgi:hypothetical protein